MNAETSMTKPRQARMKRKTIYIIATALSMAVYGGLLVLANAEPLLVWPAIAAALIGMVFACLWVVSLDEAAQQAHYIAWFWGGSAGLVVSMLTFITVAMRPEAFAPILSGLGEPYSFALGIACGLLPPSIGYLIWWAVLWLRRG